MKKVEMTGGYIMTEYPPYEPGMKTAMKCFAFVLKTEDYGAILFDTGSPAQPDEFKKQLKENFNLEPFEIKWVFNTHLHADHVGFNKYLPHARMLFSKKEHEYMRGFIEAAYSDIDFYKYLLEKHPGFRNILNRETGNIIKDQILTYWPKVREFTDFDIDFLEDKPEIPPFITPIHSPGHTMDHYVYKIDTGGIPLYILGDALINRLELLYLEDWKPEYLQADQKLYLATLKKLCTEEGVMACAHDRPFFNFSYTGLQKPVFNFSEWEKINQQTA